MLLSFRFISLHPQNSAASTVMLTDPPLLGDLRAMLYCSAFVCSLDGDVASLDALQHSFDSIFSESNEMPSLSILCFEKLLAIREQLIELRIEYCFTGITRV